MTVYRTLADLTTQVRRRADMENTTFVTDAEIEQYIQDSLGEYYDMVISAAGPEQFSARTACTLTSPGDQTYYFLAADDPASGAVAAGSIYKILAVEIEVDGVWRNIRPFSLAQRNLLNDETGWPNDPNGVFYRIKTPPPVSTFTGPGSVLPVYDCDGTETIGLGGVVIDFIPVPQAVHHFRAWAIIIPDDLDHDIDGAGSGDTSETGLVSFMGWDEYVVCDVCAKILEKEESFAHADRFLARKAVTGARILQQAQTINLDHGGAARNIDAEMRRRFYDV